MTSHAVTALAELINERNIYQPDTRYILYILKFLPVKMANRLLCLLNKNREKLTLDKHRLGEPAGEMYFLLSAVAKCGIDYSEAYEYFKLSKERHDLKTREIQLSHDIDRGAKAEKYLMDRPVTDDEIEQAKKRGLANTDDLIRLINSNYNKNELLRFFRAIASCYLSGKDVNLTKKVENYIIDLMKVMIVELREISKQFTIPHNTEIDMDNVPSGSPMEKWIEFLEQISEGFIDGTRISGKDIVWRFLLEEKIRRERSPSKLNKQLEEKKAISAHIKEIDDLLDKWR